MPDPHHYRTYTLRCWSENDFDAQQKVWRFRLLDVETKKEHAFASLDGVVAFLEDVFDLTKGNEDSSP